MRSTKRRLVINADDFGLAPGVSRGIVEAHEAGSVTSTSLMVNAPGFADAVERAKRAPRLGVGLHLNLTIGRPLTRAATICDRTGRFCGLARLIARAIAGRVARHEIANECTAQLDALRRAGIDATHVDVHHHAHVVPGLLRPIAETCMRAGIRVLRVPHRWVAVGVDVPWHADHFRGFAITGRRDFEARLLRILDDLDPGVTELMVHPGYWDGAATGWATLTWKRERELRALTSPRVRARLRRGDIELVHFGALAAPNATSSLSG